MQIEDMIHGAGHLRDILAELRDHGVATISAITAYDFGRSITIPMEDFRRVYGGRSVMRKANHSGDCWIYEIDSGRMWTVEAFEEKPVAKEPPEVVVL